MTHYLVLGAGMQGQAAAYDLIRHGGATTLTWVESRADQLSQAVKRLEKLTEFKGIRPHAIDAHRKEEIQKLFEKADICMNCLPYRFSLPMTELALETNTHYLDLGGNTDIVRRQLALASEHPHGKHLNVLPDCGLAPGMGNLFAAYALQQLGPCDSISVRCGGLPETPRPPLDYKLVFSVEGLTNEYFGEATIIRNGMVEKIATFTEWEAIHIDGLPACEAFVTSGGTSTCPWTFKGKTKNFDYKTIRYKGHYEKIKLLLDLGLLDLEPIDVNGQSFVPRQLLHKLLVSRLSFPEDKDLVILRCTALSQDRKQKLSLDVFEKFDPETGFSAMERTTAYSATACAAAIARGKTKIGNYPLEEAIDPVDFISSLEQRGIRVQVGS